MVDILRHSKHNIMLCVLTDASYDCAEIKKQSEKLGYFAIIDTNQRRDKALKEDLKNEAACQRCINLKNQRAIRYNERNTVERVNGRLKDSLEEESFV